MIVVADTSPLNYLLLLQRVELLRLLYNPCHRVRCCPQGASACRSASDGTKLGSAPPRWLEVRTVSSFDETFPPKLGSGERQAISLALELRAGTLLIDELKGRQQARARQLDVAGTLSVLVQSALAGYLDLFEELRRLRSLGFRMGSALESDTLALYHRLRKQRTS